jgi:hypothetical protein
MSIEYVEINGYKITTEFVYPPVPFRDHDWSAVTDSYDADCDGDGYFSHSPHGHGATEAEAINDLITQLQDQEHERG